MAHVRPGLLVAQAFTAPNHEWPGGRPVAPEWSLAMQTQNYPLNCSVMHVALKGNSIDKARTAFAKHALEVGAPYIWFVDDDVAPPQFAARQLINTLKQADDNVMAVGGIYTSRSLPAEPMVYLENGDGCHWKWKKDTVFEVHGIGTGCLMVKTEAFKHLPEPWFVTIDESDPGKENPGQYRNQCSDDIYFCQKLREAGFRILADANVLCVHWDVKTGKPYMLPADCYPLRPENSDISIDKAEVIPNLLYPTPAELVWLAKQAKQHKLIVEVGSYLGRSTRALADNTPGTVWAFDDWNGPRDEAGIKQDLLEQFKSNTKDLNNLSILVGDHANPNILPVEWLRGSDKPDMVFIDGSHEYEDVKRDLMIWKARLARQGLLCGHDIHWETVKQAVAEIFPDYKVAPNTNIWYVENAA